MKVPQWQQRQSTMRMLLLLLVVVGCENSSRDQGPKADGTRTYEYWCGISRAQDQAVHHFTLRGPASMDGAVRLLTAMAQSVEALPAQGVDADAIEAAHGLAESMRRLAGFLQRNVNATAAVADTVRLLFGDASVFKEKAAEAREVRTFIENESAKARKIRALLSSRYGREFPSLEASTTAPSKPGAGPNLSQLFRICPELSAVPPEVELARLRNKLAGLDKTIDEIIGKLASAHVEHRQLEAEVNSLEERAKVLGELLRQGREQAVGRVKVPTEDMMSSFRSLTATLAARRKLLAAKSDMISALQQQLEAVREVRTKARTNFEHLETELAMTRVTKGEDATEGAASDRESQLRKIRIQLAELDRLLQPTERKSDLQSP